MNWVLVPPQDTALVTANVVAAATIFLEATITAEFLDVCDSIDIESLELVNYQSMEL